MIQRIQSVYLLLAGLVPAFTLTTPLARFWQENGYYLMTALGFNPYGASPYTGMPRVPYGVLAFGILLIVLSFANIFQYKNRRRQMRICNWTVAGVIAYYVTYVSYVVAFSMHTQTNFQPGICAFLPLLTLIFTLLARHSIKKDEDLVRAADRIR
ncbi:MAG: DUF4293 domain-containing protein [Alloprevotella sp.]|nr:DUF4293 domain-containing protein [Alloprevotella sp.]